MIYIVHWLHVLLGVYWFGSQLYNDLVVLPAVSKLEPAARDQYNVIASSGRARQITVVVATATILLGVLRGIAADVLDQLSSPYGMTWLAALAIGTFMMVSVWTRGFGGRVSRPLWYGAFLAIFSLMVAMRFGY